MTGQPEAVAAYGPVTTKDGRRRFAIETKGMAKDLVICRLEGIADRDAAPAIAGDRDGFAVTWLRQTSGIRNELFIAYGSVSGGEITIGAPVQIPTSSPVLASTPPLAAVSDATYVVAWSQRGMSRAPHVHVDALQLGFLFLKLLLEE